MEQKILVLIYFGALLLLSRFSAAPDQLLKLLPPEYFHEYVVDVIITEFCYLTISGVACWYVLGNIFSKRGKLCFIMIGQLLVFIACLYSIFQ